MGHEVDRLGSGPRRMVSNAEGEMVEIEAAVLVLREPVHEAKWASGWRDVDLYAAGETGAVPRVLVASE
jgi:hypothetical protein